MNTETQIPPPIPRRSVLRRMGRFVLLGLGLLIVLAVLGIVIENWRGRHAWKEFRTEWEARGERFGLADFVPKPVPDEQNFATTPFLAPLFNYGGQPRQWKDPEGYERAKAFGEVFKTVPGRGDTKGVSVPAGGQWQTATFVDLAAWQEYFRANTAFAAADPPQDPARDVLTALKKFDPVLDELRVSSGRPSSVFPIHYDENFDALLPHLAIIKGVAQIVRLRALASLAAGQSAAAMQDVTFCLRLAEALKTEPLLISQLVRIAMLQLALQPVWEGLARHEWTDEQVAGLQKALGEIRVLEDYGRAIRGERAFGNDLLDGLRSGRSGALKAIHDGGDSAFAGARLLPGGWFYHNQVFLNRLYQERAIPLVDVQRHRVFPDAARAAEKAAEWKGTGLARFYRVYASLLYPAAGKSAMRFARCQTGLDQAVVACALERHRLATKQYPERLDALVPRFLDRLPVDVITGEPLKYERGIDGSFVLYSVGWNETDDGGEVSAGRRRTAPIDTEGDWVWRYPGK